LETQGHVFSYMEIVLKMFTDMMALLSIPPLNNTEKYTDCTRHKHTHHTSTAESICFEW